MIGPFWTKFYFMLGPNIRWAFQRTIGPLVYILFWIKDKPVTANLHSPDYHRNAHFYEQDKYHAQLCTVSTKLMQTNWAMLRGPTQTGLCRHRIWLEARNKMRNCTIYVAKTKVLISCAVTVQLICGFVFAYAKGRSCHDAAPLYLSKKREKNGCKMTKKPIPPPAVFGLLWWNFHYQKQTKINFCCHFSF